MNITKSFRISMRTFKTSIFANIGFQINNFDDVNDAEILITFGAFYKRIQIEMYIRNFYKHLNLPIFDIRLFNTGNKGNWIMKNKNR